MSNDSVTAKEAAATEEASTKFSFVLPNPKSADTNLPEVGLDEMRVAAKLRKDFATG